VIRKKIVPRRISVRNHNRLLWDFDGAIGGKTGYTFAAQKCFVGAVQRNGITLIVSILGAHDQWGDTKRLLDYGFDNYETLRTALPQAGKAVSVEPSAGARGERSPGMMVLPRELRSKPGDSYVLQVASFRERDRAETLARQIRDKGFEPAVEQVSLNGGEVSFRVRVGPFAELSEAQEAAQEILAKSGYRVLILPAQGARESG
jgi:D-alanyl-D-alanine carboxypeptidase